MGLKGRGCNLWAAHIVYGIYTLTYVQGKGTTVWQAVAHLLLKVISVLSGFLF